MLALRSLVEDTKLRIQVVVRRIRRRLGVAEEDSNVQLSEKAQIFVAIIACAIIAGLGRFEPSDLVWLILAETASLRMKCFLASNRRH